MGNACGVPDEMMLENEFANANAEGTTIRPNRRGKSKSNVDERFPDFEEYGSKYYK